MATNKNPGLIKMGLFIKQPLSTTVTKIVARQRITTCHVLQSKLIFKKYL
jgi:hypothetical protein